jgi:hypothetical protein
MAKRENGETLKGELKQLKPFSHFPVFQFSHFESGRAAEAWSGGFTAPVHARLPSGSSINAHFRIVS